MAHDLLVPRKVLEAMLEHAWQDAPRECVGLLFGHGQQVTRRVALPNVAASPTTAFYAEPTALLSALREAEANCEEHLGIYHSHPEGPGTPSPTDLRQAYDGVAHLIIVPKIMSAPATCRAFTIANETYSEIGFTIVDSFENQS